MKKLILLGIALIFFSKSNFSQTHKDSLFKQKNEIGIDLIPAIKYLSGPHFYFENYKNTLQYKRRINDNLYFRLGITNITPNRHNAAYSSEQLKINVPETHFNTGLEYRWGKRNIKYFTGMDIDYLFSKTTSTSYNSQHTILNSYSTTKNGIGVTPFIGMQYHFSKKLFFSMQLGPRINYVFGTRNQTVNPSPYLPLKFREYNVNGGLLGNFSLFYKF